MARLMGAVERFDYEIGMEICSELSPLTVMLLRDGPHPRSVCEHLVPVRVVRSHEEHHDRDGTRR